MTPILCVGSRQNDIAPLLTVARRLQEQTGIGAQFATVAPPEVATEVREQVRAAGFPLVERALAVAPPRGERNPIRRARTWRDDNRAVVDHVVTEIRPSAVLATVNPVPCVLLDGVSERGVPSLLLQLWFWGDREFRRAWWADDRRHEESSFHWKKRVRRQLERRADAAFGIGEPLEWNLRHATVAVEGEALRRQLIGDGVPAELVKVTGNPILDQFHELHHAPDAARRARVRLSIPFDRPLLTHFRNHEDRFPKIDRRTRVDAQTKVIRSLREGAPDATVVVKLHPKERDDERELIRSIDPEVVVAGADIDPNELIMSSDLVVGTFSTTLLQAVALDRPAISAKFWPDLDYWYKASDWGGVERVASEPELADAVRRNLHDPDHRSEWAARREAFARDRFLIDGCGTQRVVDLLTGMLERPVESTR